MQQINPPFDGSDPCPMCSTGIRGLNAYAHNMLNRWRASETLPEPKFWQKLDDLVRCAGGEAGFADPAIATAGIDAIETTHPDVKKHLDAIRALVAEYPKHIRPTNRDTAQRIANKIAPLVEALRATQPAINQLSEAHFDDERHSGGRVNILREQRGWSEERGGAYAWTVERVSSASEANMHHLVCGTHLRVHEHFCERIRRDKTFYAQVWCPTCRLDASWAQFTYAVALDISTPRI